jgi:outer membrane protein insertion porin family
VRVRLLAILLGLALAGLPALARQGAAADDAAEVLVADVVVEGGITVTADTVSYYMGFAPGDSYDPELVAEGFHRLWDSGLFEDVRIEVEPTEEGEVIVYVVVIERPFVTNVVFEGNKKLKESDIKDRLDERGIEIPRNVPLRMSELERIESAIKELYDEDGYRSAQVAFRVDEVAANKRQVVYTIEEGGKVKISELDFVGNEVFSDSKLQGALKKTKETGLLQMFGDKTVFSVEAWEEDRDNLRKFYLDRGYIDVKIGEPQIEMVAGKPDAEDLKKKDFKLVVKIPVEEGEPYAMGTLSVKGTEAYEGERLTTFFEVQPGQTYSNKAVEDGMEKVRELYQNTGYFYAYTNQVWEPREGEERIVDVVVDVFEGDRFRLGRLEFSGNTNTRDKVLRREFRLPEGAYMNTGVFRSSVFKVNALGYFKLDEEPVEFDIDDEEKRINVVVKGQEVGRNDVQFGAGYSELDGFFVQAQFNTRNFLGRGNSLGVSLQSGNRSDYYTISYTEPYFLDRRILLGGSIFKNNLEATGFIRETTGATVSTGLGVGTFSSVSGLFAYEDVYSEYPIQRGGLVGDPTGGHGRPVDPPPIEPTPQEYAIEVYEGQTSSFTPSYMVDSRDDPFDPNKGKRFSGRLRLAGGPLGGDFDYARPEISWLQFVSLNKKWVLAYRGEVGEFFPYSGSDVPLYERYRLGGDRTIRGFEYYTILPRTEEGRYFLTDGGSRMGGDRYWLGNVELQYRVGGPVKIVAFFDMGNTYHEDQGWDLGLWRKSTGLEMRVFLPIFQAPIRFIYGINLDPFPDEDSSDFSFSIGTTF